jgi:hypothetical protein
MQAAINDINNVIRILKKDTLKALARPDLPKAWRLYGAYKKALWLKKAFLKNTENTAGDSKR